MREGANEDEYTYINANFVHVSLELKVLFNDRARLDLTGKLLLHRVPKITLLMISGEWLLSKM